MQRIAMMAAGAALGLMMLEAAPAAANGVRLDVQADVQATATDLSAQARRRPRATLTIRPRSYPYPRRNFPTVYPLPYPVEYPGPNAVRECRARYVEDHRPSGTVIVPRMQCWWARG